MMKIEDIEQLVTSCRRLGVTKIKTSDIELELSVEPKIDQDPDKMLRNLMDQDTGMSTEQLLFYSAGQMITQERLDIMMEDFCPPGPRSGATTYSSETNVTQQVVDGPTEDNS